MSATAMLSFGTLTALYTVIVKLRNAIQTWNTRAQQVQRARLEQSLARFQKACDEEDMHRSDDALQKAVDQDGFRLLHARPLTKSRDREKTLIR